MDTLDKVFKAYDIRGLYPGEVDEALAWKVGHGSGQFLRSLLSGYDRGQASANRLVVGRDMRPHSEPLAANLMEGILTSGLSVVDLGMVDTPMIYFAINHLGTCGGVQVTASHNPIEYNGFKIAGQKARPVGENTGLKEIKHIASTIRRSPSTGGSAKVQAMDLWEAYRKHVLQFLKLQRPLRVLADASNGMAGKMVPAVFGGTQLEVLPLNFELGRGFAHAPNPMLESSLAQLRTAMRQKRVDFGVCFDGDADRCVFLDERGEPIRSDLITALLARWFLKLYSGATVIYDLRSSRVVQEEILASNGIPRRERVGHAFMKKTMNDTHAVFGGELSGHYYFRENFNADSGAIVFAVVASVLAGQSRPMSELIAPLKRYVQSGERNFRIVDKAAKVKELSEKFKDGQQDWLDGLSVNYKDW